MENLRNQITLETKQLQIYGKKGVKNLTKQIVYVPAY